VPPVLSARSARAGASTGTRMRRWSTSTSPSGVPYAMVETGLPGSSTEIGVF
jgi:hypothetical protein